MVETDSVPNLINRLCHHHLEPKSTAVSTNLYQLNQLRSLSFRHLLDSSCQDDDNIGWSIYDRVLAYAYHLRTTGNHVKSEKLETLVGLIYRGGNNVEDSKLDSVFTLLVKLSDTETNDNIRSILGSSCFLTLSNLHQHKFDDDNTYRNFPPLYGSDDRIFSHYYMQYPSSIFESVSVLDENCNQLSLPVNIFESVPGLDERGHQLSCNIFKHTDSEYKDKLRKKLFGGLYRSTPNNLNLNVKLNIPDLDDVYDHKRSNGLKNQNYKFFQISDAEDEGFLEHDCYQLYGNDIWESVVTTKSKQHYSWETIGRYDSHTEKPFLTEAGPEYVAKLHNVLNINLATFDPSLQLPKTTIVDQCKIIHDIINLMIGVPSVNFPLEDGSFIIKPGLHVEGITPDAMLSLFTSTLSAANNYRSLLLLSNETNSKFDLDLVSRMFRCALLQYLSCYQSYVSCVDIDCTLLEIITKFDKLRNQIHFLTSICKCPDDDELPSGSRLLSYIYDVAQENCHSEHYSLLLFLLKYSCRPYMRFLQDWIFEGKVDDIYGEFMVQADVHLCSRDRTYWTRAYVIAKENDSISRIPSFLMELAEQIFVCGKSLNLLKLCCPKHFLCTVDKKVMPEMSLTFTDSEFVSLRQKCESYASKIRSGTENSILTSQQHLLRGENPRSTAEQRAKVTVANIEKQILKSENAEERKKRKPFFELSKLTVENSTRNEKAKLDEASKDAEISDRTNKFQQMNTANKCGDQTIQDTKLGNVIFRRAKRICSSDEAAVIRMSITEDDEVDLNLNEKIKDENRALEDDLQEINTHRLDNLNKLTDDSNFNKLAEEVTDDLRCKNMNLQNVLNVNEFVDSMGNKIASINGNDNVETMLCATSAVLMKTNPKNQFGHVSDSSVQRIIYEENKVSGDLNYFDTKPTEEFIKDGVGEEPMSLVNSVIESGERVDNHSSLIGKMEPVDGVADSECGISLTNDWQSDANSSRNDGFVDDNCKQFAYEKSFPLLDDPPDPQLMRSLKFLKSSDYFDPDVDDEEFEMCLNMPLSVLIHRSISQLVCTQSVLVNKSIVDYFYHDLKITEHFHALRNFLFLQDGEFGHMIGEQLFEKVSSCSNPSDILNPFTLNSLLTRSLASSLHGDTVYAENLSFRIKENVSENNVTSILNCLELDYQVGWPQNIIITPKDITSYNKVFKFIIQVKRAVWVLNDIFYHLKQQARLVNDLEDSYQFRQIQLYRHEMQHFSRVLQSYIASQVLQVTWQEFQHNLFADVQSLDDLRHAHSSYLNKACFRCLLTEKAAPVIKIIQDIFNLTFKFHANLVMHPWQVNVKSGLAEHPKFHSLTASFKIYKEYASFLCKVLRMLAERGYQPHFQEFLLRLNFNDYYRTK